MTERQGLHNLVAPIGGRKKPKRVGRGPGSGMGKTSTRGHKGQKARTGGGVRPGFEGGQIPLARRQPKRGFRNIFSKHYVIINVERLSCFDAGTKVDMPSLIEKGLAKKPSDKIKILGQGDLNVALTVTAHKVSAGARKKIEAAGGGVEIVPEKTPRPSKDKTKTASA